MVEIIKTNKLYVGAARAAAIYNGSIKVYKMYAGSVPVWEVTTQDNPSEPDEDLTQTIQIENVSIDSVSADIVGADGTRTGVSIEYRYDEIIYEGDKVISSTTGITGVTSSYAGGIVSIDGSAVINGAYTQNEYIYGPDRGIEIGNERTIYNISSITFYISDKNIVTANCSYEIKQQANEVVEQSDNITINLQVNSDTVLQSGDYVTLTPTCTNIITETYTSGKSNTLPAKEEITTIVCSDAATFGEQNSAPITSTLCEPGSTVTAWVFENIETTSRKVTFTAIYNEDNRYTVTVTQSGMSDYIFTNSDLVGNITSEKSSGYFTVTSTKNGQPLGINIYCTSSNVMWLSIDSVSTSNNEGEYIVQFTCSENISTSNRTGSITVNQPESNNIIVCDITQPGMSEEEGIVGVINSATMSEADDSYLNIITYDVSITGSGSFNDLTLAISVDGTDSGMFDNFVLAESGTAPQTYTGSFESDCYATAGITHGYLMLHAGPTLLDVVEVGY